MTDFRGQLQNSVAGIYAKDVVLNTGLNFLIICLTALTDASPLAVTQWLLGAECCFLDNLEKWPHVNLTRLSKAQCGVLYLGRGNASCVQAGRRAHREQPCGEGRGRSGGPRAGREAAVCARSPEGRLHPALRQQRGAAGREGIVPLCSALGAPSCSAASRPGAQHGKGGSCWSGAGEAMKMLGGWSTSAMETG